MRNFLFLILFIFGFSSIQAQELSASRDQALMAFELLNKIRQNPKSYSKELPINPKVIKAMPALKWNDALAKVAEEKALDMATKNYFSHVDAKGCGINFYINKGGYKLNKDFLKKKDQNNFESIQAGATDGEDAIRKLIIDKGVPSLGHRYHLLGVGDWNSTLYDIGIGFVYADPDDKFKSYVSVIIAKHDW